MLSRRLRTLTVALAAVAAVMIGGSKPASADILLTVIAGGTTDVTDFGSNTFASQAIATIDGYNINVQTVVTNYPGAGVGSISTTVNILGAVTDSNPLTVIAELVNPSTGNQLPWTSPSNPPNPNVAVSASTSFGASANTTSGTVTTTTYYDSPTVAAGPGTPRVTSNLSFATKTGYTGSPGPNQVILPVTTNYSLAQKLVLTGINVGAIGFNFGGTSQVSPAPEPSAMALAGLGALGLVGYGLRRRKAMGA